MLLAWQHAPHETTCLAWAQMQAVCRPAACLYGVQVRLQLQNVSRGGERRYKGPVQTIGRIASEEGIMAPFKVSTAAADGTPCTQLSDRGQRFALVVDGSMPVTPQHAVCTAQHCWF